jgi:hypothetical protein
MGSRERFHSSRLTTRIVVANLEARSETNIETNLTLDVEGMVAQLQMSEGKKKKSMVKVGRPVHSGTAKALGENFLSAKWTQIYPIF